MTDDGEGRYRRGERRTHAEPLTASWRLDTSTFRLDPDELAAEEAKRRKKKRRRRQPAWRILALPILIIVSGLVVWNTTQRHNTTRPTAAPSATVTAAAAPPVATERSVIPVDPGTGTAVLPPGPAVPRVGAGTWHVVPGNGPVVGKGTRVYHYEVAVEDGIDPAVYGGDDAFAQDVQATLADPRSWIAGGTISLQRVDASYPHPDFVVSLTTPNTDHRVDLCGHLIDFESSCWRSSARRVIINLARWVRGALAFNGDLGLYRQYAINHEVGHVFGNEHVGCPANGALAPVMMQQTFGVSDDYVHDLNQVDPGNRDRVARDGKVCRPNAWPYPQGAGNSVNQPPG
ncbi:MAG TPA: DUF3152 domain-containing protein [Pseudonocardiaceae bacterium]|nr:DUF3152 domain-containing protein [Pseudonocardiaceae bacterium]